MPNGFITLTTAGVSDKEADFAIEGISSYVPNEHDPNGGSIVAELSGVQSAVKETVQQIRGLIAAEKGTV